MENQKNTESQRQGYKEGLESCDHIAEMVSKVKQTGIGMFTGCGNQGVSSDLRECRFEGVVRMKAEFWNQLSEVR